MTETLRRCSKCSWTGYDPRWALCPICGNTYYRCPYCNNKTEPVKTRYANTTTIIDRREKDTEKIPPHILSRFREMGVNPVTPDSRKANYWKILNSKEHAKKPTKREMP